MELPHHRLTLGVGLEEEERGRIDRHTGSPTLPLHIQDLGAGDADPDGVALRPRGLSRRVRKERHKESARERALDHLAPRERIEELPGRFGVKEHVGETRRAHLVVLSVRVEVARELAPHEELRQVSAHAVVHRLADLVDRRFRIGDVENVPRPHRMPGLRMLAKSELLDPRRRVGVLGECMRDHVARCDRPITETELRIVIDPHRILSKPEHLRLKVGHHRPQARLVDGATGGDKLGRAGGVEHCRLFVEEACKLRGDRLEYVGTEIDATPRRAALRVEVLLELALEVFLPHSEEHSKPKRGVLPPGSVGGVGWDRSNRDRFLHLLAFLAFAFFAGFFAAGLASPPVRPRFSNSQFSKSPSR